MLTLKNALLAVALLTTAGPLAAQAPAWQWARSASGPNADEVRAVATDAQGNVYVAGYFLGTSITFGSTVFTNPSLSQEAFLAKYNASGTLLWARQAGGTGFDLARGLATDPQGNVLMTGVTGSAQLSFGSAGASVSANSTPPMLGFDVFVAKYSPAGVCLWARRGGGNNDDDANAVATDGAGNVYVAGNYASAVLAFGAATVTKTLPNGGSSLDGYLVKYDAAGTPQWVRGAGGTSDDEARSVSADAAGNSTVVGYFGANGFNIGGAFYFSMGAKDLYVARYNPAGALQWVKRAGSTIDDRAEDVALDAGQHLCHRSVVWLRPELWRQCRAGNPALGQPGLCGQAGPHRGGHLGPQRLHRLRQSGH